MSEAHAAVLRAAAELSAIEKTLRERGEREDLLRFQLTEIEKLDPQPGEEESLAEELVRLRHAADLGDGTREAEEALYSGDHALCSRLAHIIHDLQGLCRFDPALETPLQQLESARTELEDAARQIRRYAERLHVDPASLAEKEDMMR